MVGYGAVRLSTAPEIGSLDTVPVASFTLTETHMGELNKLLEEEGIAAYRQETQAVHAQYLAMTETAIADGAKIILWPELAITGVEEDVQAVITQGQALAEEAGVYLAMPTFTIFPDSERPAENVLFVAGPDGEHRHRTRQIWRQYPGRNLKREWRNPIRGDRIRPSRRHYLLGHQLPQHRAPGRRAERRHLALSIQRMGRHQPDARRDGRFPGHRERGGSDSPDG